MVMKLNRLAAMNVPKADLILHPVRMRVIMALARQPMTPRQIAAHLPDIAPATLYRHLNTMRQGGILRVIEEKPVRGTVERVYALASPGAAHLAEADLASLSADDYMHLFTAFVVTLLGDFARYLESSETIAPAADGVGFHKYPLYLSEAEMLELARGLSALLAPLLAKPPGDGRRRRVLSLVIMPDEPPGE